MRSSGDRQTRVRLARRRPNPRRVRRQASGVQVGRRSIPWVHIGTAVGATAAIGGLVFTGIATYYSAKVASDQLQQSRKDAEQGARSQAERVSFYTDSTGRSREIHVVNRSPDPVYATELLIQVWAAKSIESPDPVVLLDYRWGPVDIGPCSELVYNKGGWVHTGNVADRRPQGPPTIAYLRFMDRSGKLWERTPTSLSPRPTAASKKKPGLQGGQYGEISAPQVRNLTACGD